MEGKEGYGVMEGGKGRRRGKKVGENDDKKEKERRRLRMER